MLRLLRWLLLVQLLRLLRWLLLVLLLLLLWRLLLLCVRWCCVVNAAGVHVGRESRWWRKRRRKTGQHSDARPLECWPRDTT